MADSLDLSYYRTVYDHAPCGLLIFKLDGYIVCGNQTLLNWLEIKNEDLSALKFTDLLDKGGKFYYQLFVLPLLRMQREINEISFQIAVPNANFSCLFSAAVFTEEGSSELLVNAVVYKVIDRKKYEAELLMKKAKADAEKQTSRDALRMVAFAQSHLVRAPLANILGLVSLIDKMMLDKELQQLNTMLQKSARDLDSEIRKIINTASDDSEIG